MRNILGITIEGQRTDLWTLDLRPVFDIVTVPTGVVITPEYAAYQTTLGTSYNFADFAHKITFPEENIDSFKVLRGTQYAMLPGHDEPLTPTRIEFFHEAAPDLAKSKLYCLLYCWQMLAMAGQSRNHRVMLPLLDASSRPTFMCDIAAVFLQGNTPENDEPVEDLQPLESTAAYQLTNCWISDVQLPDVDYQNGSIASITATLQAANIGPIVYDAA